MEQLETGVLIGNRIFNGKSGQKDGGG